MLCDPWHGARTPEFRKFKRNLKAVADALFLHEDDYSIWQAMADVDQGGNGQGADPLPGPNQAGHANAVRRRKRRQKTAFKIVYKHFDNERIKEMLDAIPESDRRGAEAWALVPSQCDLGTSDLQMEDIRREFEAASISKDVGHQEETMMRDGVRRERSRHALIIRPRRIRTPRKPSDADEPAHDPRHPRDRLRSLLICLQHMRRTARARAEELRRRFELDTYSYCG